MFLETQLVNHPAACHSIHFIVIFHLPAFRRAVKDGTRTPLSLLPIFMLKATALSYRNAYTGLSRATWLLSVIVLINRMGTMVVPFMTIYLTSELGYSISHSGYVFGLFGLGAFTGAWVGGRLTDRIGYYPVQLVALLGGGILFMILGQMKTLPTICVFTFLVSFVNEAFRPANSTAIAFYSKPENRTRSYALNRLAINMGWAVGTAVAGFLTSINYELLFWVDGATNITAAFLLWLFLRPGKAAPVQPADDGAVSRPAWRDRPFMLFLLLTMLFASCFFQVFTNLPVFFKNELNMLEWQIGGLMAINGIIIALIEMVLIYKLEGRRRSLVYISTGIFLCGLSFIILNSPGAGILTAFCMIIFVTFGEILSMPFMNSYWISRTTGGNRGQYAALYTMAWSAAQTLGPMAGAQLADAHGFALLWWILGGICIVSAIGFRQLK